MESSQMDRTMAHENGAADFLRILVRDSQGELWYSSMMASKDFPGLPEGGRFAFD